ncbi:MAG: glycosyltransferase family 39 protein [Candidatus Woesearchaeota archaeon]
MRSYIKKLIILYVVLVIVKSVLSYFIPAPSLFSDGYVYAKMARSLLYHGNFFVHGSAINYYPPLYPLILSLAYAFKDMNIVYFFMKFINVIISSLVIFPAWLLGKEFLSKRKTFLFVLLVALLPTNFSSSAYLLSENLFYPLFLFFIYFLYKSFTEEGYRFDILGGIFLGLCYLTKIVAVSLIPMIFFVFLFSLIKKDFKQVKKKLVLGLVAFLIVLPWFIRNWSIFGIPGVLPIEYLGEARNLVTYTANIGSFFTWIIFYLGLLALGLGVLFFIFSLRGWKSLLKDKQKIYFSLICLFSSIFVILLAVNHNLTFVKYQTLFDWITGRPISRYMDFVLPLFILLGFIGLKDLDEKYFSWKSTIFTSILLLLSSQLILFPLFSPNNISIGYLGASKYIFEYLFYGKTGFESIFNIGTLIFFSILFFSIPFLLKILKLNFKRAFYFFVIFFLLTSSFNYLTTYVNSDRYWYEGDQMQLGLWFNEYNKDPTAVILFDERDSGPISKLNQTNIGVGSTTLAGFWMNSEIIFGDLSDLTKVDYVYSKHDLDLELLREQGGFKIYKV